MLTTAGSTKEMLDGVQFMD